MDDIDANDAALRQMEFDAVRERIEILERHMQFVLARQRQNPPPLALAGDDVGEEADEGAALELVSIGPDETDEGSENTTAVAELDEHGDEDGETETAIEGVETGRIDRPELHFDDDDADGFDQRFFEFADYDVDNDSREWLTG